MVSEHNKAGQDDDTAVAAGRRNGTDGGSPRRRGLFPQDTLEEALQIAAAIKDQHAGRPYNRLLLAKAVGRTPSSSAFRSLINSSRDYGLTVGNYNSEVITLTDSGKAAVYYKSDEERHRALVLATTTPPVFSSFFQAYNQNKLPRDDLAMNALQVDFGVPQELAERCLELLKANGQFVGIFQNISGATYIMLNAPATPASPETPVDEGAEANEPGEMPAAAATMIAERPAALPPQPSPQPETQAPRVFISHSKNESILTQVKDILDFGEFDYEVAEEEETPAIPVPLKVLRAMRKCNSGLIIVSADEQEKQDDGSYGTNQNVLIEIGVAFVLYYPRVILMVDRRIKLPSNLQGLYRCDYEGEELSWSAAMKLQKALAGFRGPLPSEDELLKESDAG